MNLRLDEINNAVDGELFGSANTMATGYSIDSRTLQPGNLFFAIKGPRFDGHADKGNSAAVPQLRRQFVHCDAGGRWDTA